METSFSVELYHAMANASFGRSEQILILSVNCFEETRCCLNSSCMQAHLNPSLCSSKGVHRCRLLEKCCKWWGDTWLLIAREQRWKEFSWNKENYFLATYVVWQEQIVDRVMHEEGLRNSADWWIIILWQPSHFSSTACQTVYMGSGLPTRKSVLNHSMTSTFSLLCLCTSRTNCSISGLFAVDWGDAVEQNYVAILSWHSLSGERIINQGEQWAVLSNLQLIASPLRFRLSDLSLMFTHWRLRINTFTCESFASHLRSSPCISSWIWMYWKLGFVLQTLRPRALMSGDLFSWKVFQHWTGERGHSCRKIRNIERVIVK